MSSAEKVGASIASFLAINAVAHYCALAGGIEWGTYHMGFAVLMGNIPATGLILYIWLGDKA